MRLGAGAGTGTGVPDIVNIVIFVVTRDGKILWVKFKFLIIL